jgi:hypothetical protein
MREHRKDQRTQAPPLALVSKHESFGQIVNLSSGGFCFKYLDMESPIQNGDRIDIVFGDLTLENVPITVVWESRAPASGPGSFDLNRTGVRFERLTDRQKAKINLFIT